MVLTGHSNAMLLCFIGIVTMAWLMSLRSEWR